MALRTILLTGLRILIAWPFHDANSAKCHIPPGFSKHDNTKQFASLSRAS
jgi:hypothetical protein